MTLKIGLTGGIGSGKSTVAHFFAQHGVPIIDADQIAHQLLGDNNIIQTLVTHFGDIIFSKNKKSIDRPQLNNIIFNNSKERLWLESYLHPLIIQEINNQTNKINTTYCILEIPLLIEANLMHFVDRILVVDADEKLQINRAIQRNGKTQSEIEKIIQSQATPQERFAKADDVIINNGEIDDLKNQVEKLHNLYFALAQ